MKKEEKTPINWEVCDPKPPVIHSGRRAPQGGFSCRFAAIHLLAADNSGLMACGYPTYPDYARFDTDAVNSHLSQ